MHDAGDRSTFRTKTGWGQSGTLTAGDTHKRVTMQADFNKGVGAFDFTVQFNLSALAIVNAEALVHWRVEGQEVTRRITIGDGASLSGTGQAVRVEMMDATPPIYLQPTFIAGNSIAAVNGAVDITFEFPISFPAGTRLLVGVPPLEFTLAENVTASTHGILTTPWTDPTGSGFAFSTLPPLVKLDYNVSVQVSAGIRGSSGQPPVLQPFDAPPYVKNPNAGGNPIPGGFLFVVAAGSFATVAIPDDAGVTQIFVTAVTATASFFTGFTPQPTALGTAVVALKPANSFGAERIWDTQVTDGWVPVSPGADQVVLTAEQAPAGTFVLYSVTYGIDG